MKLLDKNINIYYNYSRKKYYDYKKCAYAIKDGISKTYAASHITGRPLFLAGFLFIILTNYFNMI